MRILSNKVKAMLTSALALSLSVQASATNITIEGYVSGSTNLSLNGALLTGIKFSSISAPEQDTESSWHANPTIDFISFSDDSETPGFYITLSVSDFTYDGNFSNQQPIDAEAMKLIGTISNNNPAPPTLNLLPESCTEATSDQFTFNSELMNPETHYSLTAKPENQIVLSSSISCNVSGHLVFDKITLTYPGGTKAGSYNSNIIFTIHDGTP